MEDCTCSLVTDKEGSAVLDPLSTEYLFDSWFTTAGLLEIGQNISVYYKNESKRTIMLLLPCEFSCISK